MRSLVVNVVKWPSKDLLLDGLKYGSDPERKFRVELTIKETGVERLLTGLQVVGVIECYDPASQGVGLHEVRLVLHDPIHYSPQEMVRRHEIIVCWLTLGAGPRQLGTINLPLR